MKLPALALPDDRGLVHAMMEELEGLLPKMKDEALSKDSKTKEIKKERKSPEREQDSRRRRRSRSGSRDRKRRSRSRERGDRRRRSRSGDRNGRGGRNGRDRRSSRSRSPIRRRSRERERDRAPPERRKEIPEEPTVGEILRRPGVEHSTVRRVRPTRRNPQKKWMGSCTFRSSKTNAYNRPQMLSIVDRRLKSRYVNLFGNTVPCGHLCVPWTLVRPSVHL